MARIAHSKPTLDSREADAVSSVIKSGLLSQGKMVRAFEGQFRQFQKTRGSVAVGSGTSALHLALLALGVKPGDEIIIPTYVCTALLNAIHYVGGRPKIVDVSEDDFNISVVEAKKKLTRRTKVIIVPHMFGQAADLSALLALGVPVIEDCAHALGATYKQRPVGSFGILSVYSFYATKMITTGEGGMVTSNDGRLIERVRDLRDYDRKPDYRLRFNYKMTDIQAAMGQIQLLRLPSWIKRRRAIAKRYQNGLAQEGFTLPVEKPHRRHVFYRYVIRIKGNKRSFLARSGKKGVDCADPLFRPIHRYLHLKGFPAAERLVRSAVSLPIYPSLTDRQVTAVIKTVNQLS